MAEKANWVGGSGKSYSYAINTINWIPTADQDGNYIFAKEAGGAWKAVYVGEGDLKTRRLDHINEGCVIRKGATHFHCHSNANKTARKDEETDVLKGNQEGYLPTGCNVKRGR